MTKPFKLVDASRDFRVGLTADSLADLIDRAKIKFEISGPVRVVLEQDGTEIDDNDYFNTLEADTSLMVLCQQEQWTPYKSILSLGLALEPHCDECFGSPGSSNSPEELVWRLHQDLSFFPWLTPQELDTIARMDTEEMRKIVPDVKFLEFLQDLSERYLQERGSGGGGSGRSSNSGGSSSNGSSILHDPIKLIRMYSKSNHGIGSMNGMGSFGSSASISMTKIIEPSYPVRPRSSNGHHRQLTNGEVKNEFRS